MHARRLIVVRGTVGSTREQALALVGELAPSEVVWACPDAPAGMQVSSPRALDRLLGQSVDAVVLDLHAGLDADAVARAEGMVRRGGALVLRMGEEPVGRAELAVTGRARSEVGARAFERLVRRLPEGASEQRPILSLPPALALAGTPEQDALVEALVPLLLDPSPRLVTLVADRGRGKSAALGRILRRLGEIAPATRCVVTAPREEALTEVHRFARPRTLEVVPALALARRAAPEPGAAPDVVIVDEAAQLPVPTLRRIVLAHPRAKIVLATTCHGYEGTGRGFLLRLVRWARARGLVVDERTLEAPIRWDAGDPLERWAFDALLLDARAPVLGHGPSPVRHARLDRERLARDERTLRGLFGLLIGAHYRTTPDDLVRVLDAPNLEVHALFEADDVVAACLVAHEGGLDAETLAALGGGRTRLRGHALADTLASHAAEPAAAGLSMIRSVRIAVHEERRRRGLARRLVEEVHQSYAPDLFGTMFGARAELISFRRALGYELVRVGVSRGARSGEPAAVMIHPRSARAEALVATLRASLARELPAQLALLEADDGAPLEPTLHDALLAGLPASSDDAEVTLTHRIRRYVEGTQPIDAIAGSAARYLRARPELLARLAPRERALLEARLLERAPWPVVCARAGCSDVAAAMRAMRPAMAALLGAHEGGR